MWSSLNALDDRGRMNIITDEAAIGEQIMAFLLTRKGEDPFAPDYGLDFGLFENLNDLDADVWSFYIQGQLTQYVAGLKAVAVGVSVDEGNGKIQIAIDYQTDSSNTRNTLTFPYHLYTGTGRGDTTIDEFLDTISLNGRRFEGVDRA